MENIKKIVDFLFELAGAKTTARTGWQRIGIKSPESLADHSALAGQIAYVLALIEGANADRAAALAIFHDTAELRTGEANWVSRIYTDCENQKQRVQSDQLVDLPVAPQMQKLFYELNGGKTKEAIIARDADYLDMAIQAKYYAENGNKKALLWIDSINEVFQTETAKEIFASVKNTGIEDWWMELDAMKKKFESLCGDK